MYASKKDDALAPGSSLSSLLRLMEDPVQIFKQKRTRPADHVGKVTSSVRNHVIQISGKTKEICQDTLK